MANDAGVRKRGKREIRVKNAADKGDRHADRCTDRRTHESFSGWQASQVVGQEARYRR